MSASGSLRHGFTPGEATAKKVYQLGVVLLVLWMPCRSLAQDVLLLRGARTLPERGVMIWQSFYFAEQTGKYDFERGRFAALAGENHSFTSYTMLGYGLLPHLELLAQLPVHHRRAVVDGDRRSAAGVGDLSVQARVMVSDGSRAWPVINFGVLVRLPSGATSTALPLGDGSADLGLSTALSKRFGFFVGHVKLGTFFNGTSSKEIDLGDEFLYMVKGDFIVIEDRGPGLDELALLIGLNGKLHFEDRDPEGNTIEGSGVRRPLNVVPMIKWSPIPRLFLRPKVVIPIAPLAEGGKIYDVQYVVDLRLRF